MGLLRFGPSFFPVFLASEISFCLRIVVWRRRAHSQHENHQCWVFLSQTMLPSENMTKHQVWGYCAPTQNHAQDTKSMPHSHMCHKKHKRKSSILTMRTVRSQASHVPKARAPPAKSSKMSHSLLHDHHTRASYCMNGGPTVSSNPRDDLLFLLRLFEVRSD